MGLSSGHVVIDCKAVFSHRIWEYILKILLKSMCICMAILVLKRF
jgi:hypothetical protein